MATTRKLPIGIQDFKSLRMDGYLYIDKTEQIYHLVSEGRYYFLSRPRRFGKSLTLNTIGTLFEKGVDPYFKGTWIYDKWDQMKYPVLHLSFLEYSATDLSEFKRQLCLSIYKFARAQKIRKRWLLPANFQSAYRILKASVWTAICI